VNGSGNRRRKFLMDSTSLEDMLIEIKLPDDVITEINRQIDADIDEEFWNEIIDNARIDCD
jgi:hypothetical protein